MFGAARLVCAFRSFEGGLHVMCGASWLACVLSDLEGLEFGWVRTFRGKYVEAQFQSRDGRSARPVCFVGGIIGMRLSVCRLLFGNCVRPFVVDLCFLVFKGLVMWWSG